MKNILIVLGVVFLVLLTAVAGFVGYAAFVGNKLDASSKAYVDAAVPAIVATWSRDELIKHASPQLLKTATNQQVDQLFTQMKAFGAYQGYDGSKGDANISYTTKEGKVVTASYVATATFEHGKIDVQIKLIQINGDWFLLGFHVERHPVG